MAIKGLPPGYTAFTLSWDYLRNREGFFRPPPHIVFYFDDEYLYKQNQKPRNKVAKQIDLYEWFWFETSQSSHACLFDPKTHVFKVMSMYIGISDKVDSWSVDIHPERIHESRSTLSPPQDEDLSKILFALMLMTRARDEKSNSILTMNRNKVSVHYRKGDTISFTRLMDLGKLPDPNYEPPEPGSSGIKKKEHDVIGHWRTYKSGVRVWVNPHRRGDPELGKVTKVIS